MTGVVLPLNNEHGDKGFAPENEIKNLRVVIFNLWFVPKYPADGLNNPANVSNNAAVVPNNPADALKNPAVAPNNPAVVPSKAADVSKYRADAPKKFLFIRLRRAFDRWHICCLEKKCGRWQRSNVAVIVF